ncbi:MAG: CDP-diacylglycerol--glycerol-3-phosphate 3-phosphatidyltransferase [Bacilli bacterium]|nr:CDP-diacylglycerol--glycerol-3-phosphate 3-phosphatidyltransferase [Bacilli bacterium]
MKINTPTKITLVRIVSVFVLLVYLGIMGMLSVANQLSPLDTLGNTHITIPGLVAAVVFVIGSATDWLDGYLARKNNQVTNLGKFLDPIADKMLVNSMMIFFCVTWTGINDFVQVPVFCVIVMVIRDLIVDTLRFAASKKGVVLAANMFGKLKTTFQMVALPFIMLGDFPFSYFTEGWDPIVRLYCAPSVIMIYIATAMSIISGVIYVVQNRSVLKED